MTKPNPFTVKVMATIRKVPRGKVATYKQIAALAGKPQGSRGVAWILNSSSKKYKLPWHRILSSQGKIAFPPLTHNFVMQKRLLEKEGVRFLSATGLLDMKKYQWKKKARTVLHRRQPRMFS